MYCSYVSIWFIKTSTPICDCYAVVHTQTSCAIGIATEYLSPQFDNRSWPTKQKELPLGTPAASSTISSKSAKHNNSSGQRIRVEISVFKHFPHWKVISAQYSWSPQVERLANRNGDVKKCYLYISFPFPAWYYKTITCCNFPERKIKLYRSIKVLLDQSARVFVASWACYRIHLLKLPPDSSILRQWREATLNYSVDESIRQWHAWSIARRILIYDTIFCVCTDYYFMTKVENQSPQLP